jgi:hypothetical protein
MIAPCKTGFRSRTGGGERWMATGAIFLDEISTGVSLFCVVFSFIQIVFFLYQWALIPRMGKTRR